MNRVFVGFYPRVRLTVYVRAIWLDDGRKVFGSTPDRSVSAKSNENFGRD